MFDKGFVTTPVGQWFDVVNQAVLNVNYAFDSNLFETNEISLPTGTATKLRIFISQFVADRSVVLGLYQSDLRLAQTGVIIDQAGYCEGNISVPITAGVFQLVYIGHDNNTSFASIGVESPSAQTGLFATTGTPGVLPNPLYGGGMGNFALGLSVFVV